MELINNNMLSNTGRNIGLGYKTSTKNQSELWFHYIGDNNNNNYGSLGLFGYPNTLAFGTNATRGNVAIGYDISNNWYDQFSTTTLSVNGNTYINGALEIDKNNVSSILRTSKALDVPGERSVDLLYDFTANTRKCIALGDDTSARRQSEFWYYHHGDSPSDTYNNFGYIGLFGHASTIAFGATNSSAAGTNTNKGNVAIGYKESDMHNGNWSSSFEDYTLSVKGSTKLEDNVKIGGDVTIGNSAGQTRTLELNGTLTLNGSLSVNGTDSTVSFMDSITIKSTSTGSKALFMDNNPLYLSSDNIDNNNPAGKVYLKYTAQTSGSGGTVYLESDSDIQLVPNNGGVGIGGPPDNAYKLHVYGDIGATSFNATSDVNKKEDIETISDATEKLTSLRGVSYKLKEDEEKKTHYGVVAQELEKVFPDMVRGEEGDKSVAYMEIIGVLIETVKDLNKRIKKLEESSK